MGAQASAALRLALLMPSAELRQCRQDGETEQLIVELSILANTQPAFACPTIVLEGSGISLGLGVHQSSVATAS